MNFKEAKKKLIFKRIVGLSVAVPALISTVISILRMLYFRLDDGSNMGSMIAKPFKALSLWLYENTTPLLSLFWEHSPVPNPRYFSDSQNFYFVAIYLFFFVGLAFLASGKKLSIRLVSINQKIEDQLIEESIKGSTARTRHQIEESTEIPSSSIFSQLHQLYISPVITAVVGALIIKLLGA